MKPFNSAFTLIELVIVVFIITILTGVGSKLWYGMEKMEKASSIRATAMIRANDAINVIQRDIRQAWRVEVPSEDELVIHQLQADGFDRQIRYFFDNEELIREVRNDEVTLEQKTAELSPENLQFAYQNPGVLRIEIQLPSKERPLYQRGGKLVSLLKIEGVSP